MEQSTALSKVESTAIAVEYEVLGTKVALDIEFVKKYLVRGRAENVTNQELVMFINTCKMQKLNPLANGEVYLIKYDKEAPAQMVVGKDAYTKRAFINPNYIGKEDGITVLRGNQIVQKMGCCLYPQEVLIGGWCRVFYERKGKERVAFREVALEEYNTQKSNWKSKPSRKEKLILALRPYFKTDEATKLYVESNLERKQRNLIMRRIRMTRKANLQTFNYFVTLTYNGEIHTEESFKKKLKNTLGHFCTRKDWRYIGVWERSPEKKRLHFHGIFYIPDGTMPGLLFEKNDYNFKSHRRQITVQNTYFNENFGRSDFEKIEDVNRLGEAMTYLMKYIEKSGEKIVYSRNLPQYFISDIMDDDVVTTIGLEDKKLLLFDDFGCWDEGEYIGAVGKDTIKRMRKSN